MSDYLQKTLSCDQLELSSMELGYSEFSKLTQNPWILPDSILKEKKCSMSELWEDFYIFWFPLKRYQSEESSEKH